jgi:glycosyltransferase involved in cell wall biosynthesis
VILTVCRLAAAERYKGYDQIIKALPKILTALPNAHYVLAGSGPDRQRVEKMIHDANLQSNVTLAGYVPDAELADYYKLCDVFAMPSKAEGFGIVYLEALACGKPVLAGNRDGSRDALADGELGLLVDADDSHEIAGEIIRVLRREHTHPNIFQAQRLRRRVIELYGTERFQRRVAERVAPYLTL